MEKSWKFQGGGGSNAKPSGTENPVGWVVKLGKTLWGGGGEYGYFLEPYNIPELLISRFSILTSQNSNVLTFVTQEPSFENQVETVNLLLSSAVHFPK